MERAHTFARSTFFLLACLCGAIASAQGLDYDELEAHPGGLGPVELGMTVAEASEALGLDLGDDAIQYSDGACSSYALGASIYEWDLRFTARKNTIVRVDIFTDRIKTEAGVGNGSAASAIRAAYDSEFRVQPGRDKGESTMQMVTDAGAVMAFVGRRPGPAQGDASGPLAAPEKVRRYSVGLRGSGATEGCL